VDWRGILIENWPYKLAALVLAALLWFNVAAERRQEHAVPTRLVLQLRDSSWVVTQAPDRVQTTFQGRGGDIFSLPMNPPVIRRVIDSVTGPDMTLDLSPSMVTYDRNLTIDPVAVLPSRVQIHLEPLASRRLPVAPRLELSAASGFAILQPLLIQPESVRVDGAHSAVASVDSVPTEQIEMSDIGQTVTRELRLVPPGGVAGLKIEPGVVLITVQVDSLVEGSFTIGLETRGPAASRARVTRDSVAVLVRGPRSVVRGLDPAEVRAYVVVDSLGAADRSLPVQVALPEGVQATASAAPASVTVARRTSGG
jgi:YbbR domain-containing protein